MESEPRSLKIVLPGERPLSLNELLKHPHWTWRQNLEQRCKVQVWAALNQMEYSMFTGRVDILITGFFKNRPQDPGNIIQKHYIDALKGKVIQDDTREYVRRVSTQAELDSVSPRTEVRIREVVEKLTKSPQVYYRTQSNS